MRRIGPMFLIVGFLVLGGVRIYNSILREREKDKIQNLLLSIPSPTVEVEVKPQLSSSDSVKVSRYKVLQDSLFTAATQKTGGTLTGQDSLQILMELASKLNAPE